VIGECSAYSSLQADSKVKFATWLTNWRPPGAIAAFRSVDSSEFSHTALRRRW